ncbi:MAG: Methyltransferase type 11, partial [Actinomycetia bacterium]|nr:Methyltransferase type 11 [Actinomycetes bacterium]
ELGDVQGKRLLHLQCHFGMDTISWAKRGASVVGADFSSEAIGLAQQLSDELDVRAEFVCSNVYDLPQNLEGEFDIVFTSYGVLCWLPDLAEWGKVINHFLAPGGCFYIVEQHPVGALFSDRDGELVASEPYFNTGPTELTSDGSYADRSATLQNKTSFEWQHPLSDVINALTSNGLRVEFLHEFPFCVFQWLPSMVKRDDGWWHVAGRDNLPFLFSLKASKS